MTKRNLPLLALLARHLNVMQMDLDDYEGHLKRLGRGGELEKLENNVQRFWDELMAWQRDREDEDNG